MKVKRIILIITTFFCCLFFKEIEIIALNFHLSWTFSKILPFLILIIIGCIFFYSILKSSIGNKLVKILFALTSLFLPFTIGFILNPIYEGDFSSIGKKVTKNISPKEFTSNGLTVVTIPNCPFCYEAIDKLKTIKKRNPKLKIDFIVCTKKQEYIKNYIKKIDGKFTIRLATNPDSLAETSGFKFPTFFIVKKNKPTYMWSNDQFGVRAIDYLESNFN